MKIMSLKKTGVAAAITLAAVFGGAVAASAATVNTSISNWSVGSDGAWRKATSNTVSQTFDFTATCYIGVAGAPTPEYAQMQLQRENGVLAPISEGNRNVGCASSAGAQSWGTKVVGVQYRYQYNGSKLPGQTGLKNGLFSNAGVRITY